MMDVGCMVLVRLDPAAGSMAAADSERLLAAFSALPTRMQPRKSEREGQTLLMIGFGWRIRADEACAAVQSRVTALGLRAEVLLWRGPRGTSCYGDTVAGSQRCLSRISDGTKTVGLTALSDHVTDGEPLPQPGSVVTVLDHTGRAAMRYRVDDVRIVARGALDEQIARRAGYPSVAVLRASVRGLSDPDLDQDDEPMVCEYFTLLDVLPGPEARPPRRPPALGGTPGVSSSGTGRSNS